MPHDQLFKELLTAFFKEFMELFYPDIAIRLDFSRVTFLDKETFTDIPAGDVRTADLIAKVYTIEGQPEIILTHIEVEARRRSEILARMHEYYMMLRLRYRLPILPIVIYLSPGAGGLVEEQVEDKVFERQVNLFTFQAVGLPDLSADDYIESNNLLGAALSALMKTSRLGRVAQQFQTLKATAQSGLDDARKALLGTVIETYISLSPSEQHEFERLVATAEGEEVGKMISVYEQRGIAKGIEQGIEQGETRGKRKTLLRQMRSKFGGVSGELAARVESISDNELLDRLLDRILTASTVDELQIPENVHPSASGSHGEMRAQS